MTPDFAKYTRMAMPAASLAALNAKWRSGFCGRARFSPAGRLVGGTMTRGSRCIVTPATGPLKLAWRAAQVLHAAGEAKEHWKIAPGGKRITRKSILAAFNDKLSFNVL
jgi:hypothetical protein